MLLVQKYRRSSDNISDGLEAYDTHYAVACIRLEKCFISNFKTSIRFLSMIVQLDVPNNRIN